ncbi:glycosyltransferase family 4 protein [Fusobacterium sp. MFO224]|uniref:glycosyltransferase family 4 protein n=1 Tax=Fusobacterium sp. MFO224 TaxID=3378070 RepID=UPI003853D63B
MKFVHICEEFEYSWIGKDNGMLPIYTKNILGWESEIVTCNLKNDLPDKIRGVRIIKIKRWFKNIKNFAPWVIFFKRIPLYFYICKNAKNIDVLMLFHMTKCSYWNTFFYKKFNPNGKVYIKADFNLDIYKKEISETKMEVKNFKTFFRKKRQIKEYNKRKKLAKKVDLISYESKDAYNYMKDFYAGVSTKGKTVYLPNGYDDLYITNNFKINAYDKKENIFLTVGRLGTLEKNTELLLEVLEEIDLKDWKFYLVGPVEKSFKYKMEEFYIKNPEKKSKVIFTGAILDKKELNEYYNRAKVFILPSRWESFGIVMVEAMAFNNYILTSNTCAAKDITNDKKIGSIFDISSKVDLQNKMIKIINKELDLKTTEIEIEKYKENFKYSKIIKNIKRLEDEV